jgi:hypothetical protein
MKMGRRLADLFQVGKMIEFSDGELDEEGNLLESVQVYLRKLSPLDTEKAARAANSARAKLLAQRDDREAEAFLTRQVDAAAMSREDRIRIVLSEELMRVRQLRESELEHDEETWGKDAYLQSLRDAWDDGMKERHAMDPEDPEAKATFDELKRFNDEIEKIMADEEATMMASYEAIADAELNRQVANRMLETEADTAWLNAFRKAQILHAVRDPENKKTPYFETMEEIDELPLEVLRRLLTEYQSLTVDATVGKDSRPAEPSSDSSEPSDPEESSERSGLKAVSA